MKSIAAERNYYFFSLTSHVSALIGNLLLDYEQRCYLLKVTVTVRTSQKQDEQVHYVSTEEAYSVRGKYTPYTPYCNKILL